MKPLMAEDKSTGSAFLDVFDQIRATFGHLGAELGLIIMAVGGFSLVMERVGASEALVNIATKPLAKMNRPYLVLACTYLLAQCLCLIIPSAAGLAMLLIVTVYPLLRSLGISKLSATGVIATGSCLDLGPASRRCPFRSTSSTTSSPSPSSSPRCASCTTSCSATWTARPARPRITPIGKKSARN